MKRICVIGSLNVDLTIRVPRFHLPGESILGTDFATYTGGKGGNQAIAAARLGADVMIVGCLGDDQNGALYRKTFADARVDTRGLRIDPQAASGVALIEVDPSGENRIVVAPGANMRLDREWIDRLFPLLLERDFFLFQLEIAADVTAYALEKLSAAGKTVILDPAPAQPLPETMLARAAYVTPNETELSILTGMPARTETEVQKAAERLRALGVQTVLAKRGRHGAMIVTASGAETIPGFAVHAVDTTAAGDSFNAGFAVALAKGMPARDAVRFANAVGALSTTAHGAQGAMPTLAQAESLIARSTEA